MPQHILEREQIVPQPRRRVFAFFADAENLERLTPPSLRFQITTERPILMAPGTLIDYRLSLFGLPMSWRTLIEAFEPEERFVDVQLRGPYRVWRHTHEFKEDARGTRIIDRVQYELPLGPLGTIAHAIVVRRTLAHIFDFRASAIAELFGS